MPLRGGGKSVKVVLVGERVGKTSIVKNWLRGYKLNANQQQTTRSEVYEEMNFEGTD